MIFEELVIHNFGIYRGRHVIDLRSSPERPIVLFGALNGSGKTTLLDALQLVLYGKLARCSNRGTLAYETFLKRSINRYVEPSEGAALELQLRHSTEHGEETVRIHRSWRVSGKSTRETVEISRDGRLDPVYTEHWYDHVDEFIPARMANLFFFDGEKIEYFADPDNAAELLRTGLHALLGLDLVDQLQKDLDTVRAKRLARTGDQALLEALTTAQQQQETLVTQLDQLTLRHAEARNTVDQAQKTLERVAGRYREAGGELFDQRQELDQALTDAKTELHRSHQHLLGLASGDAPLLLVRDLIRACEDQALREQNAGVQTALLKSLEGRDRTLLDLIKAQASDPSLLKAVQDFLEQDRIERRDSTAVEPVLNADPSVFQKVSEAHFDALAREVASATEHHADQEARVLAQERILQGLPHPEQIAGLRTEYEEAQKRLEASRQALEALVHEKAVIQRQLDDAKAKVRRVAEQQEREAFANKTDARAATHASKVQETLERYRQALTSRHIARLEHLVLESLQQLMRKRRLIDRVEIDPASYALSLLDNQGNRLEPDRLSAGERQLLAVSIVWALTKASGRPLPAVIDTPLGRLDGAHRRLLVDFYFPQASHQVILLSTDEEIDHRYYALLKDYTSKTYEVRYDEQSRSSVVTEGYPWREVAA